MLFAAGAVPGDGGEQDLCGLLFFVSDGRESFCLKRVRNACSQIL